MHVGSMAYAHLSRSVCDASGFRRETELHSALLYSLEPYIHITALCTGRLFTRVFLQLRDLFTDHGITRRKVRRAHYRYTLIAALSSSVPESLHLVARQHLQLNCHWPHRQFRVARRRQQIPSSEDRRVERAVATNAHGKALHSQGATESARRADP